ncbi:hypothetical protein ACFQ1M_11770 [Sungkyunkwania multivorans]|uniref:RING-type E3 ubiquitin transferase n=1 Tax=Sungkyunkwania multivorans TaxID=1173618 RepID=A0ABW3D0Q2_9FLAO
MDTNSIFIVFFVLALGLAAFFLSLYYSKLYRLRRAINKIPTKQIYAVKEGERTKVIGKAELHSESLYAPLSNRKCVCYHVKVDKKVSSGKSSRWKTIIDEYSAVDFMMTHRGEDILVKMENYDSFLVKDAKYNSGLMNAADLKLENYLASHGHESKGWLGISKTIRYQEGIIGIGERIAVVGNATWRPPDELNLDYNYSKVMVLEGNKEQKLLLTDDPKTVNHKQNR